MIYLGLTKVVHCKEPYDIYIGRPFIFGNPFSHLNGTLAEFKVSTREESILKFFEYAKNRIKSDPVFRSAIKLCEGKTLGCWCKPKRCHGDTFDKLVELSKENDN